MCGPGPNGDEYWTYSDFGSIFNGGGGGGKDTHAAADSELLLMEAEGFFEEDEK